MKLDAVISRMSAMSGPAALGRRPLHDL